MDLIQRLPSRAIQFQINYGTFLIGVFSKIKKEHLSLLELSEIEKEFELKLRELSMC
jgi:hypothetical protein